MIETSEPTERTEEAEIAGAMKYPPVTLTISSFSEYHAKTVAQLMAHILADASLSQAAGMDVGAEFSVHGFVDDSITEFVGLQRKLEQETRELRAAHDHLFRRTVIAESLVAQMEAYIAELESKKLAALMLAGEVKAYEFEDRRVRALNDMRDRVTMMRRRAEQATAQMDNGR